MYVFSIHEGKIAVTVARRVIESIAKKEDPGEIDIPKTLKKPGGVFTTISKYPIGDLRGCIGYSEPIMSIINAIISSAKSAATNDPRFPPVKPGELDHLTISVSLLTKPVPLIYDNARELPRLVKVGEHGLIIKKGNLTGLLLPQVPMEFGWNSVAFLTQTCLKAGLSGNAWKDKETKVYTFTAEVFEEMMPRGKVMRKE